MKKLKVRLIHAHDGWGDTESYETMVALIEGEYYSVTGNAELFEVKRMKRDWGKRSKWGKWIKVT